LSNEVKVGLLFKPFSEGPEPDQVRTRQEPEGFVFDVPPQIINHWADK
jgi:hypothetical protein